MGARYKPLNVATGPVLPGSARRPRDVLMPLGETVMWATARPRCVAVTRKRPPQLAHKARDLGFRGATILRSMRFGSPPQGKASPQAQIEAVEPIPTECDRTTTHFFILAQALIAKPTFTPRSSRGGLFPDSH